MPVAVNVRLDSDAVMVSALKTLQTFLGQTVSVDIGRQHMKREIIKLQTYLQTQGKFSAGLINLSVDDQALPAKIIELQTAANLP
jgi:hypothetical protein